MSEFCRTFDTHNQINGKEVYYGFTCDNGVKGGFSSMNLAPGLAVNPSVACGDPTYCSVAGFKDIQSGRAVPFDSTVAAVVQPKRPKHEDANEVHVEGFSTRIAMTTTVAFPHKLGVPTSRPVYVKLTLLLVDEMLSKSTGLMGIGWEIKEESAQYTVNPSQVTVLHPDADGNSHEVAVQIGDVVFSVGTHTPVEMA